MLVRDIMTPNITAIRETATIDKAAQMMHKHNIGIIPVMHKDYTMCGVLTDRDIVLRCISEKKNAQECTAGDICTPSVITIESNKTIDEALQKIGRKQVKRLVVTENETPIGIISLSDIARVRSSTDTARALTGISMP